MTGTRGVFFPAVQARDSLRLRTSIVTLTRVLRRALLVALMLPTIMACSRDVPTVEIGGISLNVSSSASVAAVTLWRVTITGQGAPQERTGSPGERIEISGLAPGSYTVLLQGFEGADLASSGQTTVMVQSGQTATASVSLDPVPPALTVFANDSGAAEANADSGTFRIVRSGSISSALAVNVSLSGTATPGADYVPITPAITMAAGMREALVVVKPILDAVAESAETVQLTIESGSGYRVGGPASATVTIADAPSAGGLNFVQVVTGLYHSCGRTSTDSVFCWGDNTAGALGDLTQTTRLHPTEVVGRYEFGDISAGALNTCGLTLGTAYCWGDNSSGQLGFQRGTFEFRLQPTAVSGGGFPADKVSVGLAFSCALNSAGAAYCWGSNRFGQLGDGSTTDRFMPTLVSGAQAFASITAGANSTCALTRTGAVYCWGLNSEGQLGDGTIVNQTVPTQVVGGLSFIGVTLGRLHTCAWTASASYCWGSNSTGQLGDGTTTGSTTPVLVSGGVQFAEISSALGDYTCGRSLVGTVNCWGLNDVGQLGDGSLVNRLRPTPVSGGLTFAAISVGYRHACARQSGGAVYCWGDNSSGQVGDGTRIGRRAPVRVGGVP